MNLVISLPGVAGLAGLPAPYAGPVLKGADATGCCNNQVEAVVQVVEQDDFAIRLFSGTGLKKFEIGGWFSNTGLYGSFMLKNGVRERIDQIGRIHIRKDHHVLSFVKDSGFSGTADQCQPFQMLDIFYSPGLLGQLAPFFPGLQTVMESRKNVLISNRVFWTPLHVRDLCRHLLESDYDLPTRQLYFDLKVREILFHLLQNCVEYNEPNFTPYEVARIHDAKAILENCIDKKPPTIRELSRMVALNEFKLKQGFRKYFRAGIFSWITAQKMQHARQLVEETQKPIKEIAALSGYPRTTNFITAFRKHHGITPGAIRRS